MEDEDSENSPEEKFKILSRRKEKMKEKPKINFIITIASPNLRSDQERQPASKAPPHPRMKSEVEPKAIQKAPSPKLEDDEEPRLLPPSPPPETSAVGHGPWR